MFVVQYANNDASVVFDKRYLPANARYFEIESIPDGDGFLKCSVDDKTVWWEPIEELRIEPTPEEKLRADIDFLAVMMGVEL